MRAVWLTSTGPGAVAVVATDPLPALLGRQPAPGAALVTTVRSVDGAVVDQVVAAEHDGLWHLHVHGGDGMRAAVTAALESHGVTVEQALPATAAWDDLAQSAHPAAVAWLLRHGGLQPPFPQRFLRSHPVVLITGATNAGKSTLLNAWCGHQRAQVSDQPGTTRDLVGVSTLVGGWRLHLVDSAGLRTTSDPLERAGQHLATQARSRADLVLHLLLTGEPAMPGALAVHGKADALPAAPIDLWWSDRACHGRSPAESLANLGQAVLERLGLASANAT